MKSYLYSIMAIGGLVLFKPAPALATVMPATNNPAAIQRKVAAREQIAIAKKAVALKRTVAHAHKTKKAGAKLGRAMLVVLGLKASRKITSPAKRDLQLHRLQKQLKVKARLESKAHRRRCLRQMS